MAVHAIPNCHHMVLVGLFVWHIFEKILIWQLFLCLKILKLLNIIWLKVQNFRQVTRDDFLERIIKPSNMDVKSKSTKGNGGGDICSLSHVVNLSKIVLQ